MLEREKHIHSKTKLDFFRQPEKPSSSSFYMKAFSTHFTMVFFIACSVLIHQQGKETIIIKPVAIENQNVSQQVLKTTQNIQHLQKNLFTLEAQLDAFNNHHQVLLKEQKNIQDLQHKEDFAQKIIDNELVIQNFKNDILEINKSLKILSASKNK